MVGAHGAGRVSYTDTLGSSSVMRGNGLTLKNRHSRYVEGLGCGEGTVSQNITELRTLLNLFQKLNGPLPIAHFHLAASYGHAQSCARFNKVEPQIVAHKL